MPATTTTTFNVTREVTVDLLNHFGEGILEIILCECIDKLGVLGDVVNVSPGYARNYLLPKKLAVLATPANMKQIEQEKAAAVRREALERKDAEALAQQISQVIIQVQRKVGENDVLYG